MCKLRVLHHVGVELGPNSLAVSLHHLDRLRVLIRLRHQVDSTAVVRRHAPVRDPLQEHKIVQ